MQTRSNMNVNRRESKSDLKVMGYLPLVSSLILNILPVVIILGLLIFVDKARHLILYQFNDIDPFYTTFLIFIYTGVCCVFFFDKYKDHRELVKYIPIKLIKHSTIVLLLPLILWLLLLVVNNPKNHIYSIAITIILLLFLISIFYKKHNHNFGFSLKKDLHVLALKPTFQKFPFFLVVIIFVSLLFNILKFSDHAIYLWMREVFDFERSGQMSGLDHVWNFILILACILLYYKWDSKNRLFVKLKILLLIFLVLFSISLLRIGSIPPLDLVLLYFIVLRMVAASIPVLYSIFNGLMKKLSSIDVKSISDFIIKLKSVVSSSSIKGSVKSISVPGMSELKNVTGSVSREIGNELTTIWSQILYSKSFNLVMLAIGLLFCFIAVDKAVISNISPEIRENNYLSRFEFEPVPIKDTMITMTQELARRLSEEDEKLEPIYIVLGQGGGSRAGCVYFNAIGQLDNIGFGKILAMITVSGSSTGAGYFLNLKKNNIEYSSLDLDEMSIGLYNKDYITAPLFKLLFTDYFTKMFKALEDRNSSLLGLELKSYEDLKKGESIFDDSWSSVYRKADELPIFIPVSYNVSMAMKAVSSPYSYNLTDRSLTYSIQDELFKSGESLTIGQSIALSEMFPVISASAVVNKHNYFDGGIYDNTPFEVGHDFYKLVKIFRDTLAPQRRIFVISVENGDFDAVSQIYTDQFSNVSSSASRSIFISNPNTHMHELSKDLALNIKDTLLRIRAYNPKIVDDIKIKKSGFNWNFIKIGIDSNSVVMSRYMTKDDIKLVDKLVTNRISTIKPLMTPN